MTNKRVHSNGRYAIRHSNERIVTLYHEKDDGANIKGFQTLSLTDEQLRDFGFEPEPDVYDDCADEIRNKQNIDGYVSFDDIKKILKKHFSKFTDTDD